MDPRTKSDHDASPSPLDDVSRRNVVRNFAVLASYHITTRMGWIFKTESIVMPAVLDLLGGTGWHRGFLPLLNRFGQSIPPVWLAPRVNAVRQKKWLLVFSTTLFALNFAALAALFRWAPEDAPWRRELFLLLYGIFFCSVGINQLTFHTLQGKLVPPNRRGRLMLASNVIGAAAAIACAAVLMPHWLTASHARFDLLFAFAGGCFGLSAIFGLLLVEAADDFGFHRQRLRERLSSLVRPLRTDRNFRRLAVVAITFGSSFMLFPHYQALGRQRLGLSLYHVTWWVIVQNIGTALFSLLSGPLADSRGNRLTLKLVILGVAAAPLLALVLSHSGAWGTLLYPSVFILVGMTPVAVRILNNYTLEIADRAEQPHYLSSVALCVALSNYASPLTGLVLDHTSYEAVFSVIGAVIIAGWLLIFRLDEPRQALPDEAAELSTSAEG